MSAKPMTPEERVTSMCLDPGFDCFGSRERARMTAEIRSAVAEERSEEREHSDALAEALEELRREAVLLSADYLESFRDWPSDAVIHGWDKARWIRALAASQNADAALAAYRKETT